MKLVKEEVTNGMRCIVCDHTEWKNVDQVRIKPQGLSQCTHCGFFSYPDKYKTEEEIKEHYRKEYRGAPTVHNALTGERKLHYHDSFLSPLFQSWKEQGLTNPVIGEIGSAMGMFLNWIKQQIPGAEVHGTELTTTFRRVAKHEFGIDLVEDFDFTKQYDMIASYHVLEHQLDADVMLKKYRDCLKDSGVMYLSTPVWFREALNFGAPGFDIEYYWAPDHINAWSEGHLEYIIQKAGLQIIFKNDDIYGNTYLLKKAEPVKLAIEAQPETYVGQAMAMLQCWKALQENNTALALELYKNCPLAWQQHYELNRPKFNALPWPELLAYLNECVKNCPNTSDAALFAGDVCTRYEKFGEAMEFLKISLSKKPNGPSILFALSNVYRQLGLRAEKRGDIPEMIKNLTESMNICRHVRATSKEMENPATTWIFHDQAKLPLETVK